MENANNILFRCSSLGYIMTDPRSKSEVLSETTKTHLIDKYVSVKYGRETELHNKYVTKGLMVEEDSITLFSLANRKYFQKNSEQLKNDYISGTPDLYIGESINKAEVIIDLKSSWDIFTFFRTTQDKLNKNYLYQLQGYMWLTGAKTSTLAYCLVNTPEPLLDQEKRKLLYRMGCTDTDPLFIEACAQMDYLATYNDIPLAEKINEIVIPRDDEIIERIKNRIDDCREWMNENLFRVKSMVV